VFEALHGNRPGWASHGLPNTDRTIQIAATADMDVSAASDRFKSTGIFGILNQGSIGVQAVGIEGTPTCFVNQKRLTILVQDSSPL